VYFIFFSVYRRYVVIDAATGWGGIKQDEKTLLINQTKTSGSY